VPTVSAARTIEAPLDDVWEVFTAVAEYPRRISAVDSVEMVTHGSFEAGLTWRETRTMFGRTATEEVTLAEVQPLQHFTVRSASASGYSTKYTFDEEPGGRTAVISTLATESSKSGGIFRRTIWAVLQGKVQRELKRDLDDLAAVLERPQ
jgi:uncharacterized membrane protein